MAIVKQHDKRIGVTYAYESKSFWDKEKKQSRSERHLIGIVDPITGEIKPTTKKKRNSPNATDISWLTAKRRFYGATYLFDNIAERTGITQDLEKCFPDSYKQILSIAYYMILEDKNPLSRFPKWSKLHTHPYGKVITSQQSSDLFGSITEEQRLNFFRLQGSRRAEEEYMAYDTTSISSHSELLSQVRQGKNKAHDKLPQINLAVLYGEESCLPFYYKKLAGNISDVSTIKQLISDMDFVGFDGNKKLVLDRGFYSEKNINDLCTEKLKFLVGTKLSLKYVRAELDKNRDVVRNWQNLLPNSDIFGFTVPIKWVHKRNPKDKIGKNKWMYLHLYYDSTRALDDERNLSKLLSQLNGELTSGNRNKANESLYEQYFTTRTTPVRGTKVSLNEEVVANERKNFGYFALIGNEKMSAERALDIYRNKDVVEKAFDNVKDRLDMRRLNVSSDLSLDGKLFVMFVALICVSFLHNAMKKARLYSKFTMNELIDELELIEQFERQGYNPQIGEVTVKQNALLAAMNVEHLNSSLC